MVGADKSALSNGCTAAGAEDIQSETHSSDFFGGTSIAASKKDIFYMSKPEQWHRLPVMPAIVDQWPTTVSAQSCK